METAHKMDRQPTASLPSAGDEPPNGDVEPKECARQHGPEVQRRTADTNADPRKQAAIDEARRTGVPPFAREAIARREDAYDRASVRDLFDSLIDDCKAHALGADGKSLLPPEPLGPVGRNLPTPLLIDVGYSFVDHAEVRACLAPDGASWSLYRTDPQRVIGSSHVGAAGDRWCTVPGCPEARCKSCGLILAAMGVTDPTDPARATPYRWPIGVRWTWTHAQMEDHLVARLRYEPDFVVDTSTTRTVESKGALGVKVEHGTSGMWDGGNGDAWYVTVAERVVRDWGGGGGPALGAHDCVVGLAEARYALERCNFAVRHWRLNAAGRGFEPAAGDLEQRRRAKLRARREGLRGWINAVESLVRNPAFYLAEVAPYEARLIEAASGGLVSA